tara:strand:+ start:1173 stop:2096 length:924 start_codon:yes stop_codon:yes gene_type:complete
VKLRQLINIVEAADAPSYENWDHEEAVSYSKYLEKHFGNPDEFTNEQAVWHGIDGFKRVVCRDEYILHCCPAPHYDFVYSYIDLEVPENLSDELANCSGSILIDHLKNEVGARCGSLTANATTLNFVMDVTAGRTEPTKDEYEKRILGMKDMFDKGDKYELDWWPDQSGDADPKNPYYTESYVTAEGTRCWKGYEKKGMKTMFGKRVPNCVKREDIQVGPDGELVFAEDLDENLKKWFKDKWVRFGPDGKIRGDCARGSSKEGKPKCLPQSKAHSLGKKGRKKAASRKRREDPNKNRRGKAKNVKTK